MYLEIVTPEATIFKGEVNSVSVPGVNGDFEMLNNHAAIVSILKKGFVKINKNCFYLKLGQLSRHTVPIFLKIL